jgi:hypothetical protein
VCPIDEICCPDGHVWGTKLRLAGPVSPACHGDRRWKRRPGARCSLVLPKMIRGPNSVKRAPITLGPAGYRA